MINKQVIIYSLIALVLGVLLGNFIFSNSTQTTGEIPSSNIGYLLSEFGSVDDNSFWKEHKLQGANFRVENSKFGDYEGD